MKGHVFISIMLGNYFRRHYAFKILQGFSVALGVVIVSYVIAAMIAKPAEPRPFFTQYQKRPMVIAHQGGDGIRPSETMMAYENAAALKVDVLRWIFTPRATASLF